MEDTKGKDEQQWIPGLTPTSPKIIRQIVGLVVEIGVKTIFSNFCYTFGGKIYLQLQGGPIGARVTMAVAQLVTEYILERYRDIFLESRVEDFRLWNVSIYVDDSRTIVDRF